MPEIKWKSFTETKPNQEYLAVASSLRLRSFWKIRKFLEYTGKIRTQLSEAKGLVGYSLQVKFLAKHVWTLSVWEDAEALKVFEQNLPHGHIMVDLRPHMSKTKFVQWRIVGSGVPPTWEEVFSRLQED